MIPTKYWVIASALLGASSVSFDAIARSWYIEPDVFISGGYDDNPLLEDEQNGDLDSDNIQHFDQSFFYVGTDIRFASESAVDLFAFDASALARRYDSSDLDSEYLSGALTYARQGERNDFELGMGLTKDSTIETEFIDTGLFEEGVDRQELYFLPSVTSRFSETWTGELGAQYRDVDFDDSGTVTDYVDYEDFLVNATLTKKVTQRLDLFTTGEAQFYRPNEITANTEVGDEEFYSLSLGLNYRISAQLLLSASAGLGRTDTELVSIDAVDGADLSGTDEEPIYRAGLIYTGQISSFGLEAYRVYEATGSGGLAPTDGVELTFTYPVSPTVSLSFGASYANRDPVPGESEEREYYSLNPGIVWQVKERFSLEFDVEYRNQNTTDTLFGIAEEADSTRYLLTARYKFGRKWINP